MRRLRTGPWFDEFKGLYTEFCAETSTTSVVAFRSFPQKGQNLSVSATSRLHCGQEGCKLHLQLGQKLKRAPTVLPQAGQEYGSGSRIREEKTKPMKPHPGRGNDTKNVQTAAAIH